MADSLTEQATITATDELAPRLCRHERHCGCRAKWRGISWLVVDALVVAGWTLIPPTPNDSSEVACVWCGVTNTHRVCADCWDKQSSDSSQAGESRD